MKVCIDCVWVLFNKKCKSLNDILYKRWHVLTVFYNQFGYILMTKYSQMCCKGIDVRYCWKKNTKSKLHCFEQCFFLLPPRLRSIANATNLELFDSLKTAIVIENYVSTNSSEIEMFSNFNSCWIHLRELSCTFSAISTPSSCMRAVLNITWTIGSK